jgi:hypothetical protein
MVKTALAVILSVLMLPGAVGCNSGVEESTITTPVITTPQIPPTTTPEATPTETTVPTIVIPQELWDKWEAENAPAPDDSKPTEILNLYLASGHTVKTDNYVRIDPRNSSQFDLNSSPKDAAEYQSWKQELAEYFKGYDISGVVDNYIEINRKHELLTAKSNKAYGDYIDYNDMFTTYLHDEYQSEVWDVMFHKVNLPGYRGNRSLSMPGYDPVTNLVLIEDGFVNGPTSGAGYIILLEYTNGVFTEVGRMMTWIS